MVADKGHEIGLHGYSHENPTAMTLEQQTAIMDKVGFTPQRILGYMHLTNSIVLSINQGLLGQASQRNRCTLVGIEPRGYRATASLRRRI